MIEYGETIEALRKDPTAYFMTEDQSSGWKQANEFGDIHKLPKQNYLNSVDKEKIITAYYLVPNYEEKIWNWNRWISIEQGEYYYEKPYYYELIVWERPTAEQAIDDLQFINLLDNSITFNGLDNYEIDEVPVSKKSNNDVSYYYLIEMLTNDGYEGTNFDKPSEIKMSECPSCNNKSVITAEKSEEEQIDADLYYIYEYEKKFV